MRDTFVMAWTPALGVSAEFVGRSPNLSLLPTASKPWVTIDFALAMFGDDRIQARDRYRSFVEHGSVASASPLCELNASDPSQ